MNRFFGTDCIGDAARGSFVTDLTGEVVEAGKGFFFTDLKPGDLVSVTKSKVASFCYEKSCNSSVSAATRLMKMYNKGMRSAEVIYAGLHYVTIKYTDISKAQHRGESWSESFGIGDFDGVYLLRRAA